MKAIKRLTVRRGTWVVKVADSGVHKVAGPLDAGLTRRRLEDGAFERAAGDFEAVKLSGDQARDEARERIKLVEPDTPELGDCALWNGNTAEQGELNRVISGPGQ